MTLEIKYLREFVKDKEGILFETLRSDDRIFDGKFGQNLVSILNPGEGMTFIKGFHLHEKTTEYTTCISGSILYIGVDTRTTPIKIEKVVMGDRNRALVKTLPGTWHGYMNLNKQPAVVLYTMDRPYNPNNTDIQSADPFEFGDIWTIEERKQRGSR